MRVLRIAWLGIATNDAAPMVSFLESIMGLRVEFAEPATTELSLPNDDRIQVFGPHHPYFGFYRTHATGPVPLFEVEDVRQAAQEAEAAGLEIIGTQHSDENWTWIHLRAPDGNLYALASRRHPGHAERG